MVIARSLEVSEVAAATAEAMPDLALVGLGDSSEHALELISQIVQEAACPVIARSAARGARRGRRTAALANHLRAGRQRQR
jgi:pyruvate carboxylase